MFLKILRLSHFLLIYSVSAFASQDNVEITFLDTGYADAILINAPGGRNVLLDGGDVKKPELVAEFLKTKKTGSLEMIILSHPHKNHFGALFRVLDEINIREIVWNGEPNQEEPFPDFLKKIKEKNIPLRVVRAGEILKITENLTFTVFHPSGEFHSNINNNSLVLKMEHGKTSVLFTTDIGTLVQDDLIEKFGENLTADLVQIPHHGGPISQKFTDFFKPDFFALSTGPNEWDLNFESHIAKLQSPVIRTDKMGNLVFYSDGKKIRRAAA